MVEAIEHPAGRGEFLVSAIAALLGPAGLAASRADRQRFAKVGLTALTVALVEQQVHSTTILVTTLGLRPPTLH